MFLGVRGFVGTLASLYAIAPAANWTLVQQRELQTYTGTACLAIATPRGRDERQDLARFSPPRKP